MDLLVHVQRMAIYNRDLNRQVYGVCGELSGEQLGRDRGAFFHSILGTLNHILVGDIVWLKRFSMGTAGLERLDSVEQPRSLDAILYGEFCELQAHRVWLDDLICDWVGELGSADLKIVLDYCNMKGVGARRSLGDLLCHFFNHQTHHRGQVTTLLSQEGLDVGVTDLLNWIAQVE